MTNEPARVLLFSPDATGYINRQNEFNLNPILIREKSFHWHRKVALMLNMDLFIFCLAQNKEFVCRGHDYERLEAFQQRMLGEFPQAIAMQHPNQPDEAILQCDAQCIL